MTTTGDGADGGDAPATCTAFTAWTAPRRIESVSSPQQDKGPWLSDDRLTLVFSSNRGATRATYIATRSSETSPFSAPTLLYDSMLDDDSPYLTSDQLTMFYSAGGATTDLFVTARTSSQAAWSQPSPLAELNSTADDDCPEVSPDLLTIHYSTVLAVTRHIVRATRARASDAFGVRSLLPDLVATTGDDTCPTVAADGTIYFASSRVTDFQIWFARPNGTGFMPPSQFGEVSSPGTKDLDPFITRDGRTFLWASDRLVAGDQDLWMIQRECL